jgi:hypothetical protein
VSNVKIMDKPGRQSNILILIFKDPFAGQSSMLILLILRASSAGQSFPLILESVDTRMG